MNLVTLKTKDLALGAHVDIRLGGLATTTCVVTEGVCGTIERESEKAVMLSGLDRHKRRHEIWLPKRALCKLWRAEGSDTIHAQIAPWFHVDERTWRGLSALSEVAGISA